MDGFCIVFLGVMGGVGSVECFNCVVGDWS